MVDYKLILTGTGLYLTGFIGCLLGGYILVSLLSSLTVVAGTMGGYEVTTLSGQTTTVPMATEYMDNIEAIGWLGLLLVWILATMVVPLAIIVEGLMRENESDKNPQPTILSVTGAILWALFTILIFYFANNMGMMTGLANSIPTESNSLLIDATGSVVDFTILLVLFWLAVAATIITNVFIVPAYIIAKYRGS